MSSDRAKKGGEGKSHKSQRTEHGHPAKEEEQGNQKTEETLHQEAAKREGAKTESQKPQHSN